MYAGVLLNGVGWSIMRGSEAPAQSSPWIVGLSSPERTGPYFPGCLLYFPVPSCPAQAWKSLGPSAELTGTQVIPAAGWIWRPSHSLSCESSPDPGGEVHPSVSVLCVLPDSLTCHEVCSSSEALSCPLCCFLYSWALGVVW